MLFEVSLAILILVLGLQIIRRFGGLFGYRSISIFKSIFILSVVLIFILLFYNSFQQYQSWSQNEVSKYLLPPHQSINYFIFYVLTRFFGPYLISLGAGLIFLLLAKILNKKYDERFFYPEEYYLGGISIFLTGHPGWLFYAVFLLIAYLLIHFYSLFIIHNPERLSLYYLWIPMAIFVIIISKWLGNLTLWQILKL